MVDLKGIFKYEYLFQLPDTNQKSHGLPNVGQIEFLSLSTQTIQRSVDFFAHLPTREMMPLPFCGLLVCFLIDNFGFN